MLQAINDRSKGWLGIFIVVLITLPFAFWGINSYVGGGGEQYAAKVNDIEISPREFEYNLSNQRQKLQKQFGGKLPFEDVVLKRQVMDQLVNRKLLEDRAADSGYSISDAQLTENIKKVFTRDGKFDRAYVDQILQSKGMSASQMEYQLRSDMQISQIMDSLINTSFITDEEARRVAELENQQRKISTLIFSIDHFSSEISVTEEEIKSAYEVESERFMLPEKISIEYVELKSATLSNDVKIDEAEIKAMYDEYVAIMSQKEQRKARHILLKTDKDVAAAQTLIIDIRTQLTEGASFDALARKYSQDAGSAKQGGDLGWVEAGQMVKPFEDALYAMKVGELSDVIESQFGLHLIKLEKIQSEPVQSLQKKRAELEKNFKQEVFSNKFYDLSEQMATTAYENSDSLISVTEALNVQVKNSEYFTRDSGTGIANNEKIRAAAFSRLVLEDKSNSDVIEISPEHILVLRVLDRKPASLLPLDSVRSSIENNLKLKKSHETTLAAAREAKTKINEGQAAIKDVISAGVTLEKPDLLTRKDTTKVDPMVLEAAFNMSVPVEGKVTAKDVAMSAGDVALVILEAVYTPINLDQAKIDTIKKQLQKDVSTTEFNTALSAIREKADLHINAKFFQ